MNVSLFLNGAKKPFAMRLLLSFIIVTAALIIGCTNPDDRQGRTNIFDENGDNWFPPKVMLIYDTLETSFSTSVAVACSIKVMHGPPQYLVWSSNPTAIDTTELLDTLKDSTVSGDTVTYFHQSAFSLSNYDTVTVAVKAVDIYAIESAVSDTVVLIDTDTTLSR